MREQVQTAERYVNDASSWQKIASYRQGNVETVNIIQSERKIDESGYSFDRLLGTRAKTRGLRTDPDIKAPLEASAKVVVASVVINRPKDSSGQPMRDYWTAFLEEVGAKKRTSEAESAAAEIGAGIGRRGQRPDEAPEEEKVKVAVLTDLQRAEMEGVFPARLGLTVDEHTTKIVKAVVVTALFPHELQLQEFDLNFKDRVAYRQDRDRPHYVAMEIQRQIIADGVDGEWEDITEFVTKTLPEKIYAAGAPEVVDEHWVDPRLTVKIPPFVLVDYKSIAGNAKVPLLSVDAPTDEVDAVVKERSVTFEDFNAGNAGQPAAATGRRGMLATGIGDDAAAKEKEIVTQYKLIRFIDVGLNEGEQARYRIRVWLADPNNFNKSIVQGIGEEGADGAAQQNAGGLIGGRGGRGGGGAASLGADPTTEAKLDWKNLDPTVRERLRLAEAEKPAQAWMAYCRPSPWSDPTDLITIPRPVGELVAGRVESPSSIEANGVRFSEREPSVSIVAKKWDPALQVQVPAERKVRRAEYVDFRAPATIINPINRDLYDLKKDIAAGETEENGIAFDLDAFVVDALGGERMPFSTAEKAYYYPSEMIVLDGNGVLSVRSELKDRMEYRHALFAEDEQLADAVRTKPKDDEAEEPGTAPTSAAAGDSRWCRPVGAATPCVPGHPGGRRHVRVGWPRFGLSLGLRPATTLSARRVRVGLTAASGRFRRAGVPRRRDLSRCRGGTPLDFSARRPVDESPASDELGAVPRPGKRRVLGSRSTIRFRRNPWPTWSMAPLSPMISVSPDQRTLLRIDVPGLPSIAELAQPELRLAGVRLARGFSVAAGLRSSAVSLSSRSTRPGRSRSAGSPNRRESRTSTGRRTVPRSSSPARATDDEGTWQRIELWVASRSDGQAQRVVDWPLSLAAGIAPFWAADSRSIVAAAVPADAGDPPRPELIPEGPVVQENDGQEAPVRTYQDLLASENDALLFEYYYRSQLTRIGLDGSVQKLGPSGLHVDASLSPSGEYLLVESVHRSFSYLVPVDRFPRRIEIWDAAGAVVRSIAELPLQEDVPLAFGSVPVGARGVGLARGRARDADLGRGVGRRRRAPRGRPTRPTVRARRAVRWAADPLVPDRAPLCRHPVGRRLVGDLSRRLDQDAPDSHLAFRSEPSRRSPAAALRAILSGPLQRSRIADDEAARPWPPRLAAVRRQVVSGRRRSLTRGRSAVSGRVLAHHRPDATLVSFHASPLRAPDRRAVRRRRTPAAAPRPP